MYTYVLLHVCVPDYVPSIGRGPAHVMVAEPAG